MVRNWSLLILWNLRRILVDKAFLIQLLLIEYVSQSGTFIVDGLTASLTHVLFAIRAITKSVFFFTFRAQHPPSVSRFI
jgi:hypothetical protein